MQATISQSSVVVGNLALFIQSLYQRDKDGIVKLGSIVFICFASIFKSFMARKAWILLVFVIGAIVFCSNVMHLRFSSHFDHHCLSRLFWRAFKNAAFSQVKTQSPFLCYSYYAKMLSHPCWIIQKVHYFWRIQRVRRHFWRFQATYIPSFYFDFWCL